MATQTLAKKRLQGKWGTLRACSEATGISYYRLSNILNGYADLRETEVKVLELRQNEVKNNRVCRGSK